MTERPSQETAAEEAEQRSRPMPDAGTAAAPRRTAARPSPTSRARRSAAVAPEGLRRPSPRPGPTAAPASFAVAPADESPAAPGTTERPAATAPAPASPENSAAATDSLGASPSSLSSRPPAPAAGTGRRGVAGLIAALAVAVVALAALDGWLLSSQPASGSRTQRDQALSTAKTAVPLVLSYDYRHFGSDVAAAKARLTGRAVTDYVQAMTKTIKPTATKVHAVVQAETDAAGVEAVSGDGKQVTVVVFGEQKVTNTSLTAPRIDLFRVRVTLDRVQGQWLVSKFDQI
jgi:Mce-associated membrane protein